jgi:hypothetical protein
VKFITIPSFAQLFARAAMPVQEAREKKEVFGGFQRGYLATPEGIRRVRKGAWQGVADYSGGKSKRFRASDKKCN